ISGLPENIYGNVKSARPKTLDETIELCNTLRSEHEAECLNIRWRYIYGSIAQDLRTTTKRVV
ncbi:hypothetical protein Tco_0669567, partial [Tanacetum coccineum]